jgi:bis(5'-nucleosyl)-tetraphosphatase (symmetrical)
MEDKGTPGTQAQGMYPWFEVPGRVERELKMVCGHWSALGLTITQGVHAIDTGAVWGGKLTALQLDSEDLRVVQVPGRDVPAPVPGAQPPRKPQAQPQPQPERRAEPRTEGGNNERGEQRRRPRRHRPRGNGNGNGNPGANPNKPAPTE